MKTIKSKEPYLVKDSKNHDNYYVLLLGLLTNQLNPVKIALSKGVNINKLYIEENPDISSYVDGDENNYQLIPALEYAQRNCSAQIFKTIIETCSLSQELKAKIVFKSLAQIKSEDDITKNLELQDVVKTYVNKKNINQYFKIKSLHSPLGDRWDNGNIEATFLHVACETLNVKLIELLINLGANVNLKVKKSYSQTPAHIVIETTPPKGDQSFGIKSLLTLFRANANCDLKNNNGHTVWESAVNKFKVPELRMIFANKQPHNLTIIEKIKIKSPNLYTFWQQNSGGFIKYPLINDIFKYENLTISLGQGFSEVKDIEKFFKNKSLKAALTQRYGIAPARLCSLITNKLFLRDEDKVVVQPKFLQKVDVAYNIFYKHNNSNISDFLEVLEKESENFSSVVSELAYIRYSDYKNIEHKTEAFIKVLKKIYTDNQIKSVLTNDKEKIEDSIDDIMDMYNEYPKQLDAIFKRAKYSEIDNLQYLHDFLSGETNALEQENFRLEQEKFKPELAKLSQVKMSLGYGVKLAQENHDLIKWGAMMGHCVGGGSYAKEAQQGKTIILAITKDQEPRYCIELSPQGSIRQVQGKSHSRPDKPIMEEFVKELKSIGVLNKSQKAEKWDSEAD